MSASCHRHTWSELAIRENDGLAVSLLWSRDTGRVKVAVVDVHLDEQFEFHVPGADALAAFHHPFAYAAGLGASFGDARSCRGPRLAPERNTVQ
jgi:hypothetical protein